MNMCIFIFIEIFLAVLNIRKVEVMNPFTRMKDWIRTIRTIKTKGNKQTNNNTPYKMHSLLTNESAHKDTHTHTYTKTLSLALPFIRNVQTFNFAILKHFLIFPLLHFFMSIFHLFWFVCVFPHSIVRYSFRSEYIRLLRTILFFFSLRADLLPFFVCKTASKSLWIWWDGMQFLASWTNILKTLIKTNM